MTHPEPPQDPPGDRGQFADPGELRPHLRAKTITGLRAVALRQGVRILVMVVNMVVISRILTPGDFGIYSLAYGVISLANAFKDMGLSSATINARDLDQRKCSTLYWINIGLALIITAIAIALIPIVAMVTHEPRVVPVLLALLLIVPIGTLKNQHRALMARRMEFMVMSRIDGISLLVGCAVSLGVAFAGGGVWSLVASTICADATNVVLTHHYSSFRPGRPGPLREVEALVRFGLHLQVSAMINWAGTLNRYFLAYGHSAAEVGLFTRASSIQNLPVEHGMVPLENVLVSTLRVLVDRPDEYRRFFLRALWGLTVITVAGAAALGFGASFVVRVALGPQWHAAIPVLRGLSPLLATNCVIALLFLLPQTQGQGWRTLVISSMGTLCSIVGTCCGLHWGVVGAAWGMAIASAAVHLPASLLVASDRSYIPVRDLLWTMVSPGALMLAASGAIFVAGPSLDGSNLATWQHLLIGMGAGAACLLIGMTTAHGRANLAACVAILRNHRKPATPAPP